MRKHFLLGLTAVAAMCLFSCTKENVRPSESTQTITFTALTPDTKTHFGAKDGTAYPTLWTGNEQVAVSYNGGEKTSAGVSGSGKSASINAEIAVDEAAAKHKFTLASPAAAISSFGSDGDIYFTIPSVQTPGEGTCDEAAQIIYATASCTAEALNSNISLTFKHLTAYGNMSVTLPEGAGKVKKIELLTAATGLTGSYGYGSLGLKEDVKKDELTLLTDKTTGIFFACAPADLKDENLVVTVTTDKGVYEKDIDLTGKTLNFAAGKVSKFTVKDFKVKTLVTESWNLVTDASTLKVGDELVIASNEKGVVAGNITTDNILSKIESTFSDDMSTITELRQDAVVFTLGGEADAWTLSNSEGKLLGCTALRNIAWAKGTTTWKISINTSNDATIQSTNTSYGRFLYNVNSPRFTTYTSSTNTSMLLPQIYRRETTIVDPNKPVLTITPGKYDTKIPAAGQTLTFTVMTNQADWTVTSSDDANFAVTKAADSFTVTVSENTDAAVRTATITVTAGELTKTIALTQSGAGSVNSVTYTPTSATAVITTKTAPVGSSITFKNTYNNKNQITKNNSQTYTIKGFEGCTIKKVVLSMKSNKDTGAGTFSLKAGTTELAAIKAAKDFNQWYDNTKFSSSYKDVTVSLTNDTYTIKANEDVVIVIKASVNSLYCQSVTIEYEQ